MIEIDIDGVKTIREEHELYREFVNTTAYNFCKFSQDLDASRSAIGEWMEEKKYKVEPDNNGIIEYIAMKI